jgi:asparagine synthase (glutamine-hydrolysing)
MKRYIAELDSALENTVKEFTRSYEKFGLLFSGGLDSSLLAKICIDLGKKPTLLSVFMAESPDDNFVLDAASNFDLEHKFRKLSPNEVVELIPSVSRAIESNDLMDLSIGVPLYAAMKIASNSLISDVMAGQGADELFAGYHRYLRMSGEILGSEIDRDVRNINIKRDMMMASSLGIRLSAPYLNEKVVEIGMNIPVDLKIKKGVLESLFLERLQRKEGFQKKSGRGKRRQFNIQLELIRL